MNLKKCDKCGAEIKGKERYSMIWEYWNKKGQFIGRAISDDGIELCPDCWRLFKDWLK